MPTSWRNELATRAAIAAVLLLWAAAFAGIRAGLESYGPGELAPLRFGTASAAALISTSPVLTAILSASLLKERVTLWAGSVSRSRSAALRSSRSARAAISAWSPMR